MKAEQVMSVDRFRAALGDRNDWATIEELLDTLDDFGFWTEGWYSKAEREAKKVTVRHFMKSLKDDGGFDEWANIKIQDEEGKEVHVYKQESLFNKEDYRQVVNYHRGVAEYHGAKAIVYEQRGQVKFQGRLWD